MEALGSEDDAAPEHANVDGCVEVPRGVVVRPHAGRLDLVGAGPPCPPLRGDAGVGVARVRRRVRLRPLSVGGPGSDPRGDRGSPREDVARPRSGAARLLRPGLVRPLVDDLPRRRLVAPGLVRPRGVVRRPREARVRFEIAPRTPPPQGPRRRPLRRSPAALRRRRYLLFAPGLHGRRRRSERRPDAPPGSQDRRVLTPQWLRRLIPAETEASSHKPDLPRGVRRRHQKKEAPALRAAALADVRRRRQENAPCQEELRRRRRQRRRRLPRAAPHLETGRTTRRPQERPGLLRRRLRLPRRSPCDLQLGLRPAAQGRRRHRRQHRPRWWCSSLNQGKDDARAPPRIYFSPLIIIASKEHETTTPAAKERPCSLSCSPSLTYVYLSTTVPLRFLVGR
mmetsp:Transcript_26582/g.85995  ORF Transcript_26582/g.85995 Transcript_26582/m.85995 type:complete len:396 (-) Transcript_26582:26-1213(-)